MDRRNFTIGLAAVSIVTALPVSALAEQEFLNKYTVELEHQINRIASDKFKLSYPIAKVTETFFHIEGGDKFLSAKLNLEGKQRWASCMIDDWTVLDNDKQIMKMWVDDAAQSIVMISDHQRAYLDNLIMQLKVARLNTATKVV